MAGQHPAHQPAARHHRVHAGHAAAPRAGAGAAARRHRRLSRRVADRPAAAGAVLCGLVAPGGCRCAGAAALCRRQGLARLPLHARCRHPRRRADRADGRRALHALSAGRARTRPRADRAGPGRFLLPGDLAGSPAADLLPAAARRQRRLRARHARRHAGAPLRELQDPRRASRSSATTSPASTGRSC